METEEMQPSHRCNICHHFDALYVKKDTRYDKICEGYCQKQEKLVDRNGSCESWEYRHYWRSRRTWVCERVLVELLSHLMSISQIMQEERYEKNKDKR